MQEPERKDGSWGQAASKEGRLNPASGLTVPSRKVGSGVPDLSVLKKKFFLFYIEVQLINNVEIVSDGQQRGSAIPIHVSILS